MEIQNLIANAEEILRTGLNSVDPYTLILEQVRKDGSHYLFSSGTDINLNGFDRVFVCGAGKGSAPMARAMEELLGENLTGGDVIVKYDHLDTVNKIRLHQAGHPVPDGNTIKATRSLLETLQHTVPADLVFVLLTGGGSALLEDLPDGVTLDDLQKLSRVLLECGADIHEINSIRKHISRVKGGQLARFLEPARVVTLALSDVIGDDLSVIASGPTHPDRSTFGQAWSVIEKYSVGDRIPHSVFSYLTAGVKGEIPETPKPGDKIFTRVDNIVIGSNRLALATAEKKARELGYKTIMLSSMVKGEAKELAVFIASVMKEIRASDRPVGKPACLLLGGEPTVQITGTGKGGRNQELCLALALEDLHFPFVFVSCGSDGTDGPTDAAGAMVTHQTMQRAHDMNLNAGAYLRNNDSYHFFESLGDLIKTGPTRTNVMDLIFALIPVT